MSTFNLKLEYPEINYDWFQVNSDATAKCPANWKLHELNEEYRYFILEDNLYGLLYHYGESVTIPFSSGKVNIESLTSRQFVFRHNPMNDSSPVGYTIRVYFNDTDYQDLIFGTTDVTEPYESVVNLPNNTEYIKIGSASNTNVDIVLWTDVIFDIYTDNYDINTEQNDVSIGKNKSTSKSISGKLLTTNLGKRDVNYKGDIILSQAEEKELNNLVKLAKKNKLLVSTNINIHDEGSSNLSNIPYGGAENTVKYWYNRHDRTQNTALYSYITLSYKKQIRSKDIYI